MQSRACRSSNKAAEQNKLMRVDGVRKFPVSAAVLLGLGLGAFFDGIAFHRLLQWHHMLSSWYALNSIDNVGLNTTWDGIFHSAGYVLVLAGDCDWADSQALDGVFAASTQGCDVVHMAGTGVRLNSILVSLGMPQQRRTASSVSISRSREMTPSMDGTVYLPEANNGCRLRLLVASDVRFVRESLGDILGKSDMISVVGRCGGADQVLAQSQALQPDMVLLDAAAPGGLSTVRQIRASSAGILVVVFALIESAETVLTWTEAGASGYISNTAATADIVAMITEISAGRQACSAAVVAGLLRRMAETAAVSRSHEPGPQALTRREAEIARLVSSGMSNKEIARNLRISLATTKSHVHSALCKLRVQRRGQIATWMHARPAES
ncbi:MAG: DUF2243 domain-containing protein [Bradyrhizobium sp.]|nr:DUF2243 domain-containing protein [Bradyrhizobium sp.]